MPEQPSTIEIPSGIFCITTYGCVRAECVQSLLDIRGYNAVKGLNNIQYTTVIGNLVDKARNEAARQLLQSPHKWLLFLDADMQPHPNMVELMLHTAYGIMPWADAVGAYCQLRGSPYLSTTDFGSGTWEP